jgi:hypothetical protein
LELRAQKTKYEACLELQQQLENLRRQAAVAGLTETRETDNKFIGDLQTTGQRIMGEITPVT